MPRQPYPRKRHAAALIIVVAFIVLMSAMVVAFFSRVGSSLADTRSYAESVSVRQLADSAVGVVMGQIREATTVPNGAWASQPGMIRVYRSADGLAGPEAHAFYKLYSSHDLVVSRQEVRDFLIGEYEPSKGPIEVPLGLGGWRQQPAYFTDLNQPASVALVDASGRPTGKMTQRFPIFDPALAGLRDPRNDDPNYFERAPRVEGMSVEIPANLREQGNEAPMPVRWIYVLRDGTLTAPLPLQGPAAGSTGRMASWNAFGHAGNKTGVPTKTNPIVGRIAFWADDDTNKVNINTAGGFIPPSEANENENLDQAMNYAGSYWDTPRMQTKFDRGTHDGTGQLNTGGLANAQPGQNEFQRYPGHPATTSLGLIFRDLLPASTGFDSEKLYAWLPRLTPGGSRGGTFRLDTSVDREMPIKSALEPDAEGRTFHLFSSVDEMLYASLNGERVLAETTLGLQPGTISPAIFDRARFLLTAHSRAPELSLFGRPRVTIWPVWNEPAGTDLRASRNNPSDHLIRFCSTIGKREFLFAREKAYSTSHDFNLSRNQAIFKYLRELTSKSKGRVPGFGGSFEEKLNGAPGGRDQLLTEIFDYIRTVNLKDTTRFRDIDNGEGTVAEKERFMFAPRGIVAPTRATVEGKRVTGFGRFPTISEASLVFYFAGAVARERANPRIEKTFYDGALLESAAFKEKYLVVSNLVRAFLVLETFNPMQGYAPVNNLKGDNEILVHEINFDSGFSISSANSKGAQAIGFKNGSNRVMLSSGDTWGGRNFGGTEGFMHTLRDKTSDHETSVYNERYDGPGDLLPETKYPFYSRGEGVRIPAADRSFSFSGGKLTLRIKLNAETMQTVQLNFPSTGSWPVPTPQVWRDQGGFDKSVGGANPKSRRDWASFFERRLSWVSMSKVGEKVTEWDHSYSPWELHNNGDGLNYANRWRNLLQPGDTVRSLIPGRPDQPSLSDPRLVALMEEPGSIFQPHPDYYTSKPRATTLRRADGAFYLAGADDLDARVTFKTPNAVLNGSLIDLPPNKVYGGNKGPDLPPGVVAKRSDGMPADFDTGIGNYPDGAFAGKADEGNVVFRWFDAKANRWSFVEPYFSTAAYDPPMDTFFSPNRQIPSAVMFGSLLSRRSGWETLLFSPNPAGDNHPGAKTPKDHLLLDLFTMPVVEPYAISEPFSTAGKINLNYAIAPFGYLKRTTALRAALHPLRVTAMPQSVVDRYKSKDNADNFRYLVDRDQTVRGFEEFFAGYKKDHNKGFFKAASEICDRYLYPKGKTHAGKVDFQGKNEADIRQQFWKQSSLTGDNVREKPYADLYPRVTTKSNTYTVHYRVQTLRQRAYTGPAEGEDAYYRSWDESRDSVLAEYRGNSTIERYLDPEDERFKTSYTKGDRIDVEKESLEDAYRVRVIFQKRFSPW